MSKDGPRWTDEQQKVIDVRNRNILVSAAAGSGKTAVLVERIITMISDKDKPVDIDKLLVVTFTNAAAAEMSERIAGALEKKVEEDPDNMFLRRQVNLVRNAHICTFHSFCQSVIRNHFNQIGLDPSFRIGDEIELGLMQKEVLEDMFEEHYALYKEKKELAAKKGEKLTREDRAFVDLIEAYAERRSDLQLREQILQLYGFSISYPWPEQWLDRNKDAFRLKDLEEMVKTPWMEFLMEYLREMFISLVEQSQEILKICMSPCGPEQYAEAVKDDIIFIEELKACKSFVEIYDRFCNHGKWTQLSRKKVDNVDPDKKQQVKDMRDLVKKSINDIEEKFFFEEPECMLRDLQELAVPMETLMELTKEFKAKYQSAKEEKRVVDFNDLEHYALQILLDEKGKPTAVADSYRKEFVEILVDEYQDSNEVQETILGSICQKEPDYPNLFMVGDVKQSIYKFRMARPELFMEKYDSYSLEDGLYQRIDLHKNFRSRGIVLDSVNEIFQVIMKKSLGRVEYNKDAFLYLGNEGFPDTEKTAKDTELLLLSLDGEADLLESGEKGTEQGEPLSKIEWEARMVVARMKELVDPEKGLWVVDKKTQELRLCRYGDIAILLRSVSGWSDVYLETLKNAGIPVYTDTRTGYFSTFEIRTILQLLKVVDNPRQDIPMAAVMRSMFGKFTGEEMAIMRNRYPNMDLVDTVESYGGLYDRVKEGEQLSNEEINLSKKADFFLFKITDIRKRVAYTNIHQLLEFIYRETGFYDYVSVMPNGAQRRDNLDMLIQKALDMEATGMSTLFHFNRYIEKLHKYEVDFGEALGAEATEDAVRIMSIHKSKGLEFPVVIVAGMAKQFNQQDNKKKIVLHLDSGIGTDIIDVNTRTKAPTVMKKAIAKQIELESLGEELRVLYVALTRAKEKLIMAACIPEEAIVEQWQSMEGNIGYLARVKAKSYLDWVGPIVASSQSNRFVSSVYHKNELVLEEVEQQVKSALKKRTFEEWEKERVYNEEFKKLLEERLAYSYAYEKEKEIASKLSVSDLKHIAMDLLYEDESAQLQVELCQKEVDEETKEAEKDELQVPLPVFLQEKEEIKGAQRGTVYHKVFEKLNLEYADTKEGVLAELERMVQCNFLTREEADIVEVEDVLKFTASTVAKRMGEAEHKKRVWKEQPFVIGLPAVKVKEEWDSQELILVQGIIDAYFEEEDGIVLLDYKTDRVSSAKRLADLYREQLKYYAMAIEQMTGKKVKEQILYWVTKGVEVKL